MAMKIKLFRGFLPNYANGIHYYFDDFLKYIAYASNHSFNNIEIDFDNYRLNTNFLSVSKAAIDAHSSALFDYGNITYVIAYDEASSMTDHKPYFMAYRVLGFAIQSNNVNFELEVDLWASYIYLADIKKLCVSRCNKKITGQFGLFDDIPRTKNLPTIKYFYNSEHGEGTMDTSNVGLLMLIRTVTNQNIFGNNYVSTDFLAYAPLDELVDAFEQGTTNIDPTSVDLASRIAGGVYAHTFGTATETDAKVLKAWLVPLYYLNAQLGIPTLTVKYKTCYSGAAVFSAQLRIPRCTREDVIYDVLNNCEPTKKWFIGGFNNSFEITNAVDDVRRVFVTFNIGANNIVIYASDGSADKDITSCFEIPVIGLAEEQSTLEKISFWSKYIGASLGDLQQATTGFNTPASAALGISRGYLNFVSRTMGAKAQGQGQNGIGDGTLNYSCKDDTTWLHGLSEDFVYSPLKIFGFDSTEDEKERVNLEGINYSCVSDLATLFASSALFPTAYTNFPYLFLKADCIIDGIPVTACDEIKNKLSAGVYLENII